MSNSPIGETVDLPLIVLESAANRIVNRAMAEVNSRYKALLEANSVYQTFLTEASRARESARKFRQISEEFYQKAQWYKKKVLGEEQDAPEGVDYRTEVEVALANAQVFREMSNTEEEKTLPPVELSIELRKLRENAFNRVAGQLGYNTLEKMGREAAAIIAEERVAEERRVAIVSNQSYLDRVRNSAESLLRSLFGEEYAFVGKPEVLHVDGALNYEMPATIFTDDSTTVARLQQELQTSEGVLTLASKESIPLDNGTSMMQVIYRGSRPLH